MKNVHSAFNVLEDSMNGPQGFQFIKCHMLFDVKMEGFHCKAHLVTEGSMTNVPATFTYISVVTCETEQISLMLTA